MPDKTELKACDKCTSNRVFTTDDGNRWSWAYCSNCGKIGLAYPDIGASGKHEAIKAWNTRTGEAVEKPSKSVEEAVDGIICLTKEHVVFGKKSMAKLRAILKALKGGK